MGIRALFLSRELLISPDDDHSCPVLWGRTAAGADNSLLTYVFYLYKQAFQVGQMGYAAALSVVMFVVSVALAAAVFRWARGWVFYGGEEA